MEIRTGIDQVKPAEHQSAVNTYRLLRMPSVVRREAVTARRHGPLSQISGFFARSIPFASGSVRRRRAAFSLCFVLWASTICCR